MSNKLTSENFKYSKDTSNDAILGVLEGPCADIINPTRNGRTYPEELWQKVFNDPIVNEQLESGGIFGELDHPSDNREETDSSRIAIAMKEKPQKKNGVLWAKFYILNTPLGKILKTLCDFGYKIGISSRGSGDLITDRNGNESVDPDTYEFRTFDAVLVPAVKAARLQYVTESLNKKTTLVESLNKLVENATADEKAIMQETITNLHLDEEVNYNSLANEAKAVLKNQYDDITNNTDLINALKTAIEENRADDIQNIAKLLQKYDPDYVKLHDKINQLAENPIKPQDGALDALGNDFTADIETTSNETDAPMENSTEQTTDAKSDVEQAATELAQTANENKIDNSTGKQLVEEENLEKNIVYNNIINNDDLNKILNYLELNNCKSFEDFEKLINVQQQQHENADDHINEVNENTEDGNSMPDMINALQEALKQKQTAETESIKLTEKLSVCYAKEAKQEDLINSLKEQLRIVEETHKNVEKKQTLTEAQSTKRAALLTEANTTIRDLNSKCSMIVEKYNILASNFNKQKAASNKLTEDLNKSNTQINELKLTNKQLTEDLSKLKNDYKTLDESCSKKLTESTTIIEKYKKVANTAISKYIDSQAIKLGVKAADIKQRLPENYTFNDIDKICENLQDAKVSMNMLPFRNPGNLHKKVAVEIKEQLEPILGKSSNYNVDDEIDDSLKTLAGM